ncbi:hypothetical protein [Nocardioides sp.]|uniref:hypothetical protein n=1 Tax=Nocardioides sp. TaxID=35761 RepID=UPI002ED3CD7E
MRLVSAVLVAVLLVLGGGCADDPPAPDAAATRGAADLDLLLERLETIHPEPFHGVPREEWVGELRELQDRLPDLSPDQTVVEVMRLVALLSREGRDGHQFALPQPGHEGPMLPLRLYFFEDGGQDELVVTDAMPPYDDLVGGTVTALGGVPVEELLTMTEPLVPRDGPATVPTFQPQFVLRTEVLRGLGLMTGDTIRVSVELDGSETELDLVPVAFEEHEAWAGWLGVLRLPERPDTRYLRDLDEPLTWERLGSALYVRLTEVRAQPEPPLERAVRERALDRLVLDLRQNPGGDNHNNAAVVALVSDFQDRHPEAPVAVITDRVTFSAASNLTTDLERLVDPVFVGEPMGGGLNFWNDVTWVHLDDLRVPMQVGVSTRYWQQAADPADPRLTIEPDVPVTVEAEDYFAGRDPTLDAALGVLP